MRIIDAGKDFVQMNSWTLSSLEEKNKKEIFSNIASVKLKAKKNVRQ
jgi:hypothetical protein